MTTTTPGFRPTHVVPPDGMPAWDAPDPVRPTVPLDALLPVRLVERRGDWGHVLCANGWSAWVDGRLLVAVPQDPPAAGQPLARTADPRPLLARVEETLRRYRQHVEELAAGRLDREAFHDLTTGMRVGIVVEGESVWLYEAEHERWVYCDGTRVSTYATGQPPSAAGSDLPAAEFRPEPPTGPGPGPSDAASPPGPAAPGPEPPVAGGHAPTQVVRGVGPAEPAPEPAPLARSVEPEPARGDAGAGPESPEGQEGIRHAPTRLVTGDGDSAGHGGSAGHVDSAGRGDR
ncbi:hypothetical protein [Streptomyces liliiviolaceus]|uniref:hypothetical protein n=1 Tax=Streptomyces liliiviolaceus TaxID=2823109 RepID=UPI001FFCC553|nr:hypothetical protein [Streptomyces liliiviolaceus]